MRVTPDNVIWIALTVMVGCFLVYNVFWSRPTPLVPGCLDLAQPATVFCNVERTPIFTVEARQLCQHALPARWVVTSTAGRVLTVVGGECFTVIESRTKAK